MESDLFSPTSGSGFYDSSAGAQTIINSRNITLIGSGKGSTRLVCGRFGSEDQPCSYRNFQIRNSSYVHVYGVTFTQCGPITSAVYISDSEFVVFEDCSFQ